MSWFSNCSAILFSLLLWERDAQGRNQRLNTSLPTWNMGPTRGIKKKHVSQSPRRCLGSSHIQDTNQLKPLSCEFLSLWVLVLWVLVPISVLLASLDQAHLFAFCSSHSTSSPDNHKLHTPSMSKIPWSHFTWPPAYILGTYPCPLGPNCTGCRNEQQALVNNSLSILLICASCYLWSLPWHYPCHHGSHRLLG